jgi:hypothetical protein
MRYLWISLLLVGCSQPYIRVVEYGVDSPLLMTGAIGGCRVDFDKTETVPNIHVIYKGEKCTVEAGK